MGEYESYGCGAPKGWNNNDLGPFLESITQKYIRNTGISRSNVLLQAAGFTFRARSEAKL